MNITNNTQSSSLTSFQGADYRKNSEDIDSRAIPHSILRSLPTDSSFRELPSNCIIQVRSPTSSVLDDVVARALGRLEVEEVEEVEDVEDVEESIRISLGEIVFLAVLVKELNIDSLSEACLPIFEDVNITPQEKAIMLNNSIVKWQDSNQNIVKDIVDINLKGKNLSIIPEGILLGFTNLTSLDISDNELENTRGLGNLEQLKKLNLSNNRLEDTSELGSLVQLERLNLSMNKLENTWDLESLINLKDLNISRNQLTDMQCLNNLENIEWLDISDNELETVRVLTRLENPIKSPPSNIGFFGVLSSLGLIQPSRPKPRQPSLLRLRWLNISSNKIKKEEIEALNTLTNLEVLILYNNPITNPDRLNMPSTTRVIIKYIPV